MRQNLAKSMQLCCRKVAETHKKCSRYIVVTSLVRVHALQCILQKHCRVS